LNGSAPGTVTYFDTNDLSWVYYLPYTGGPNSIVAALACFGDSKAVARITNFMTNAGDNVLYAHADDPYVKTTDTITYDLGMSGLQQTVFGYQAFCSSAGSQTFSSGSYTSTPFALWIISPITAALDYSAGRTFGYGATAVNALLGDALFTPTSAGLAQMLIDANNGVIPTQFSDSLGGPVAANRLESNIVVIDDTAPYANVDSAMQTSGNVLGGTAIAGAITFNGTSYDNGPPSTEGSGLTNFPTMVLQFASGGPIPLSVYSTGPNTFAASYTIANSAPCGVATITMTSTDDSGNVTVDVDSFDVNPATITFNVVMDGALFTGSTTRGIEFVVGGTGGSNAPVTINKNVTFAASTNTVAVVLNGLDGVPCDGPLTRMSVKDKKHTLRKLVVLTDGGSEQYTTADVHLKSGDAQNDNVIDVLDYGVFASFLGSAVPASTPDGYGPLHPDFSGNAFVGTEDFGFVGNVGQYLSVGDALPGNYVQDPPTPKKKATVREMLAAGAFRAAEFDLNHDGWVTFDEITNWIRGRRG
jgi:hypothetical protein